MLDPQRSSFIVSSHWPPSGASLSALNEHVHVLVRVCSSTMCGRVEHRYIYTEPKKIYAR